MAALIRCGLRKSHNLGKLISSGFLRHELKTVQRPIPGLTSVRCLAALPDRKKRLLIDVHSKIDHNVGISTELFNSLMSLLEEHGSVTEHDAALLLHICSSGPFDAPSSIRLQFAEKIWNSLDELGVPLTSKLYNMKLKAYCLNDKSFTPLDELAAMKSLGINPDKITYGYLIEGFCRNGDIAGANHVLEAMNDAQYFIGISIFNSFITGHLIAGSPEEASNVLETLRSRGLAPNNDTFFRFIQHYASEGDTQSVVKYIKLAEEEGVPLDQSLLIKVYRSMLLSGHMAETDQIVSLLLEKDVFRNTSMQSLCQLVAEGFHREALDLYLNIPKAVQDSMPNSAGSFLLKSMIVNEQSVKDILDVSDKLVETNPSTCPQRYALHYAHKLGRDDLAINLLEEMMSRSQDVRIPHILPALCHYRNTENLEGVYKTVDMILSVEPCEETMDALDMFCYPALKKFNLSDEDIVNKWKKHERKWNTFFMFKSLQTDGYDAALEKASTKPLDDALMSWLGNNRGLLTKYLPEQKEACAKLLTKLMKKNNLNKFVPLTVVLNRLDGGDVDTVHFMLDSWKQAKLRFPDRFLGFRAFQNAPQDIQDKLKELTEPQQYSSRSSQPYSSGSGQLLMKELRDMSKEDLEDYVKKNPSFTLARIALLNKALLSKDLEEIHKRLREIKALKFTFPKYQLVSVIVALADLGDVEAATEYFNQMQEQHGYNYIDTLALTIAAKQMEVGNFNAALEMIDAAKKSTMTKLPGKEYVRRSKISSLMDATRSMEEADAIHEALVKGSSYLTGDDANITHYYYIRKALESDDDKALLARLTKVRDQYWKFPCKDLVISRFIKKQDIESLKEVMNLGISVVGNNIFHHKLACNFIACDMPSKAAEIFQKLGDNINTRLLETNCKYFIKQKEVAHIETLVEMVKSLPVSRAVMLKYLIEAHVSANDMTKATEVLHTFDNEFLVPFKSTLYFLVDAFKGRNMEQPEILKSFLSKRETLDVASPKDEEISSSSSSSSSSSESESDTDSDTEKKQDNESSLPQTSETPTKS